MVSGGDPPRPAACAPLPDLPDPHAAAPCLALPASRGPRASPRRSLSCLFWEILGRGRAPPPPRPALPAAAQRSARPRSRPILGKAAAAARYVPAVSQRAGMRRTLCSPLGGRTCWDRGAAGADITARAAPPRAPPAPRGSGSPCGTLGHPEADPPSSLCDSGTMGPRQPRPPAWSPGKRQLGGRTAQKEEGLCPGRAMGSHSHHKTPGLPWAHS